METPPRQRSHAFTLIELMVVVVIVSILAAMIFPVISSIMENTKRTQCIHNQRQLLTAVASYAADHDGFLPSCGWDGGGARQTNEPGWLYGRSAVPQPPPTEQPPAIAAEHYTQGALWPYIQSPKIYFCPFDRPTPEEFAQRKERLSSYCMNGAVNFYSSVVESARILQFPGNAVCFWEQREGPAGFYFNDSSNHPGEGISDRHNSGAMVGCFDGHVEWMTWPEYDAEIKKRPGRFYCNPQTSTGS